MRTVNIIVDLQISDNIKQALRGLGINLIDAAEATKELTTWSGWEDLDPGTTLLVFPGNGACHVKRFIPRDWLEKWQYAQIHAKRYWKPGISPIAFADRIFPGQMVTGVTDIVILDDAVSSGSTARMIKKLNEPWIPGARWHILSWVSQRNASVKGFRHSSFSPNKVGTDTMKHPLNSLSTLVKDKEVRASFIERNLDPCEAIKFLGIIEGVK